MSDGGFSRVLPSTAQCDPTYYPDHNTSVDEEEEEEGQDEVTTNFSVKCVDVPGGQLSSV